MELERLAPLLLKKIKEYQGTTEDAAVYYLSKQSRIVFKSVTTIECVGPSHLDLYESLFDLASSGAVKNLYASQLNSILSNILTFSGIEVSEFINKMPETSRPLAFKNQRQRRKYQPEVDSARSNYKFYVETNPMCWKTEDCSDLSREEWYARMKKKMREIGYFQDSFKKLYDQVVDEETGELTPEQCAKFAQLVSDEIRQTKKLASSVKEEKNFFIIPQLASLEECVLSATASVSKKKQSRQFFRPPDLVCREKETYEFIKVFWRSIGTADRLDFLLRHVGKYKVEIVEAFYPIFYFAFGWDHGLAMSFIQNKDNILLVHAEAMCKALSEDDQGYFLESYAAFRIDIPLALSEKDGVRFRNVETIQHSFLLFRKAFLDIVALCLYHYVRYAMSEDQYLRLMNESSGSKRNQKKRSKRRYSKLNPRDLLECIEVSSSPPRVFSTLCAAENTDSFLSRMLPTENIMECIQLIPLLVDAIGEFRNAQEGGIKIACI